MEERDQWGIADGWSSTDGTWMEPDPQVRDELRCALGAEEHPEGPPTAPVWFVHPGQLHRLRSPCTLTLEDSTEVGELVALPPDLPLGAHRLHPIDSSTVTDLFVVPERAPLPSRGWGWSAQLYSTRSQRSWGHGDLSDLAELARWADRGGASLLAHNPLGAPLPTRRQQPSPYSPSSRRWLSPLYLDVTAVTGAELLGSELDQVARAGEDLNSSALIDRDRVWALKRHALLTIFGRLRATRAISQLTGRLADDVTLERYATFCALTEAHDAGWHSWPAELAHPGSAAVAEFAARNSEAVDFHRWLQFEADLQLSRAATSGAGLVADLPVGFDPDGFDAWHDQDLLAASCSIGAPPDDLGPQGQNWGIPPYVPWRLRRAAYRPWLDTLRAALRNARALRIDHVMGLFRLFWIPPGADATRGAYVYQFGAELLDLALMEAARAGASLIGEDLGTVETSVREAMGRRNVFGYRVGWFEDDAPDQWPTASLGSLTTHDLPTAPGLWSGVDAADRAAAGLAPDPSADALLRGRLARLAGVDPDSTADDHLVTVRAYGALARGSSTLVMATIEDAVGERHRPNVPGTVDENPNWRRPLPVTMEQLDRAGAQDVAEVLAQQRQR